MSEAMALVPALVDEDTYLAAELAEATRHEYVDGTVRTMAGTTIKHNGIAGNLYLALRTLAKGSGCRVTMEGVRLRVSSKRHYYPDVMATCEPADDLYALSAPCLIAEVLSPTTSTIDRGEKRIAYLAMESLCHLLLIDPDGGPIEHTWRLGPNDPWMFELGVPGGTLQLRCPVDAAVAVDDILADA